MKPRVGYENGATGSAPPVDFSARFFSLRPLSFSWHCRRFYTFGKRKKKETNVEQESRTRSEPMRKTRETW